MKKALYTLAAAMLLLVSCDVSDDEPTNSNTDRVTDVTIENAGFMPVDEAEFKLFIDGDSERSWSAGAFTLAGQTTFTSCRLDDSMLFNADGTYTYDGGANLCGAEDNQEMRTGTWDVNFDNKTMTFDAGTSFEQVAEVIGLNENEIRLKGSYMMMEVRGLYTASN